MLAAAPHAQLVDAMPLVVHLDAWYLFLGHASQQWLEIRAAGHHDFGPLWLLVDLASHHEIRALFALETAVVVNAAVYSLIAGAQE